MCPQTAYSIDIPAVSYPGQPVDGGIKDALSALNVAAAVPYGVLVVNDSANSGGFDKLAAKVPASAAEITTVGSALGIVMADQARAQDPSVVPATYPQKSALPCLKKGRIWVQSETAVVDGAPVFARFLANGALTQLGAIRADADTTSGPVDHAAAIPGAVFRGGYAAPGFVVVEMDLV